MKSERKKSKLLGMVMKTHFVLLLVSCAVVLPISAYGSLAKNPSMEGNFISQGSIGDVAASWTTGGPYGGYINSLAMAETNPDIIYAGTDSGVFKTVDGGDTWTKKGIPEILVRVVQVAPHSSDIIYAGTDDGIYKSKDGGNTWTQKELAGAKWVTTIAIDPLNPDIVYAGTRSDGVVGIFKSTDAGESWHLKCSRPGWDAVAVLLCDTDRPSQVYAGIPDSFFLKSTDAGDTWRYKEILDVTALAMTPAGSDPGTIYAIVDNDFHHMELLVFKSTDRGESWIRTSGIKTGCVANPYCPASLAVDPNDADTLYLIRCGSLYKSTDGGYTWLYFSKPAPGDVKSIVIDPRNSDVVYVGLSEGGVYKSTDGGESWNSSSQGLNNAYVRDLAVYPTSCDSALAVIKGQIHPAKTINRGASWDYVVNSPTFHVCGLHRCGLGAVAIDPLRPDTIWLGDGYQYDRNFYVYKSADGGQSWTSIHFFVSDWIWTGVTDILIKADDSDALLVSMVWSDGILARTTDGGQHWQQEMGPATALAADPNNPNLVYCGTEKAGQVLRSSGFGARGTWSVISPTEFGDVRDIEVDLDSKVYVAASDGLWRWNGSGWTKLTGLPTDDITALAIDRFVSPGIIYVGTEEEGVFVSRDGGNTWTTFNEGLERLSVNKLAISASQPKILYAGIRYGGVWSTALDFVELIGDFCGANFGSPDGYVDVWDLMQFADHWHTRIGDSNWDPQYDLAGPNFADPDGYIDVWDLMVFADHWHEGQKP